MLAGVCGGLARYFEIHPAFYRVGFVVLTLIGGAGILVYLAAVLVIPDEGRDDSIAAETLRERRDRPWPLIGLGAARPGGRRAPLPGHALATRATPPGSCCCSPAGRSSSSRDGLRAAPAPPPAVPPRSAEEATTAVAAPAAAAPAKAGRHVGRTILIVLGSLVALFLVTAAIFVAIFPVHLSHGVGHKSFTPTSAAALERDLPARHRRARPRPDERPPARRRDARERPRRLRRPVEIVVPSDVAVRAYGSARLGYVNVLGDEDDGRNADERSPGRRRAGARRRRQGAGRVGSDQHRPTMRLPHAAARLRPPR